MVSSASYSILLIDDNNKERTYYAERIRMGISDCTVLEARDGRSGLALYRSRKIDCIITELYLPDMSGLELLVEVVPQASQPAMAVILLTRNASKPIHDLAIRNGAQAFFVKRFTSGEELTQMIPKAIASVGPNEKTRLPDDQIN